MRPLTLLLLLTAPIAGAQTRPLQTEEAATAPAGTLVLEAGAEGIRDAPSYLTGGRRDRWDLGVLRLVWSPADNVEIDLEWTARVVAVDDPDLGTVSDFGDVALRTKLRLVEEKPGRLGLSARFGVTLPETRFNDAAGRELGLGPNALRMFAQALASRTVGRLAVHGNLGLALHDEVLRPHEQRDFLAYGLGLEAALGRGLTGVAEVAGLSGKGMPGADAHHEARAGIRWRAGRVRWDAAVRRGLGDADGRFGLTAGLAWTLKTP